MINIQCLHVRVRGKEILHGVNLQIPRGEVHALFGPNGSGKSVLIMTLLGFPEYEVTQGRILIDNRDLSGLTIDERVRKLRLGLSEQRPPTIKGVTFRDLLDLLVPEDRADRSYVERMLHEFRIERFLDREINDGLSGGEIKQAELFLVLASQPKFLVLDEPDSGVDPEHLKKIARMINETLRDKSIERGFHEAHVHRNSGLIATHSAAILDFIHTDKAHVMMDGKIKCSGNSGIMMDQIRTRGYEHCITCQNAKGGTQ